MTSFHQITHFPNEKVSNSAQDQTQNQDGMGDPSVRPSAGLHPHPHGPLTEACELISKQILPGTSGAVFSPPRAVLSTSAPSVTTQVTIVPGL